MANEIEKFDPSKLMEGVKDRIKATFVSLIPDELWDSMVEKEVYVFTTGRIKMHHDYVGTVDGKAKYNDWEERIPYSQKPITDNWGNEKPGAVADISPLQKMIRELLRERFRKDLAEFLDSEEYHGIYLDYGQPQAGKAVEELLVNNADTVFHSFMAGMLQSAIDNMRYHIRTTLQGGGNM